MVRNEVIDWLRAIGLVCIILAHVDPPSWIFKVRTFDVPLMVFISGMSFSLSSNKINWISYFIARFKRLVYPTWLFIAFYFISIYFVTSITGEVFPWDPGRVLSAFLLTNGFPYVWIIRVFLMMAIAAPILSWLHSKIKGYIFLVITFTLYLVIECVITLYHHHLRAITSVGVAEWINPTLACVHQFTSYAFVLGLGLYFSNANRRSQWIMEAVVLAMYITVLITAYLKGMSLNPQEYKYPPHLFYVAYGVFISLGLYESLSYLKERLQTLNSIIYHSIQFISSSVLWIYLWHIYILYIIDKVPMLKRHFALKFILVVVLAVSLTYSQKILCMAFMKRMRINSNSKHFLVYTLLK
jgi:hypothetical protein